MLTPLEQDMIRWIDSTTSLLYELNAHAPPELRRRIDVAVKSNGPSVPIFAQRRRQTRRGCQGQNYRFSKAPRRPRRSK